MVASITLVGCKSYRGASPSVEIRTSERIVTKMDTIYVEIPQHISIHTSSDSVSVLEDDFAVSEAIINPDGTLTHTLQSKPHQIPVEVESKIVYKDSIAVIEKPTPIPAEKRTAKLSAWDRFRIKAFGVVLALAIMLSAWCFRKPLATLLKKILQIYT